MGSKICYQCRTEVDILASVCPACRAKLGSSGTGGVAKKPTSTVVGCLAVFLGIGVVGTIIGSIYDTTPSGIANKEAKQALAEIEAKKEIEADENMIKQRKVRIGMTAEQCRKAWGKPQKVNKTTTQHGTREQWVYGNSYLYIENGVLTAIQN